MKKLAIVLACLCLSACGTTGLPLPGTATVTDTIRQLCPNVSDAQIIVTLNEIINARNAGTTRNIQLNAFIQGCVDSCLAGGGTVTSCSGCAPCGAALYQQAWPE